MKWLPLAIRVAGFIGVAGDLPPGMEGKLGDIGGWIRDTVGWLAGIAFVIVGAIWLFAWIGGNGSPKAIRALLGAALGCLIISSASFLSDALTEPAKE